MSKLFFLFIQSLFHLLINFVMATFHREEEEEEEEVVDEAPKKKKYSRDGENPTPWSVGTLGVPHHKMQRRNLMDSEQSWEQHFFPSSDFSVKNSLFAKAVRLKFPD